MPYFTSILLTGALTGFLAFYAWRQPALPGVRMFAGLALSACLLALAEILSMLSGAQAQAFFWFNLRFFFAAIFPVTWLAFALAYSGQKGWLSKKLLAGALVIPAITQVMLWSNSLHGLWVKQEVGFHQNGPLWIADTSARIPGLWFMVHSFYSLILLLAGAAVMLLAAWRMRKIYHYQALLLAAGALVVLITTLIPTFNLLPQASFNPFIPGIGIGAVIYALAILRFQFLKRPPVQAGAAQLLTNLDAQGKHSLAAFLFIFILFTSGVAAVSYLTYQNYAKQFRTQAGNQLSAITDLKVKELERWRKERLADAKILYQNPALVTLAQRYFENPADSEAQAQLQTWLESYRAYSDYDRVRLLDTQGVTRLSDPNGLPPLASTIAQRIPEALQSGQVTLVDFYRRDEDQKIYLAILIPILDRNADDAIIGLVTLNIDPEIYLYPFIQNWPVSSASAETLLIRREGEAALFLNPLRFQPDAALNLRIPLEGVEIPSVKAILGQDGIVAGLDYRGAPVIADIRAVPGSPWFLVAKMDTAEVYAPLSERLWQMILLFSALSVATAAGLALIWRQQRLRYYRVQVEAAEALAASEAELRALFSGMTDVVIVYDADGRYAKIAPTNAANLYRPPDEMLGKTVHEVLPKEQADYIVAKIRATLQSDEVVSGKYSLQIGEKELWFASNASRLSENTVVWVAHDITERKQTEDKLLENKKHAQRMLEQQIAINQFALALGESLSLDEIYHAIHDHLLGLVDLWCFIISSYDDQTRMIRAEYVETDQVVDVSVFPLIPLEEAGRGTQSRVIRSGQPLYTPDHRQAVEQSKARYTIEDDGSIHEELPSEKDSPDATRSAVYLPMKIKGKVAGVMQVQSCKLDAYRQEDIDLLAGIANVAAVAIQNARLHEDVLRELTERKRFEEALRWRNEYLVALQETTLELLSELDLQTLLGNLVQRAGQLMGTSAGFLDLVAPETGQLKPQIGLGALAESLQHITLPGVGIAGTVWQTGQPLLVEDYDRWSGRIPRFSSNAIRSIIGVPLLSDEQVIGVLGLAYDAASDKVFDQEAVELLAQFARLAVLAIRNARLFSTMQKYSENLEETVRQRTQELRDAQERLIRQERLAVLGQLAGSVSHELRNPLGVISNAIYFLSQIQPDANAKVKEYLEIINDETHTADKIITDLLDFSRSKSVAQKPVAVADLVRRTLERFPTPTGVTVTLDLPEDLPAVYADPQQMVQMLGNLVVNACQAMPQGGQLVISSQQSVASEQPFVAIRVQDSGVGITPENMRKLFEPLFTTKLRGIGLGLAVCKNLAEANGGRIEVQSEPGKGSTFTLYLPRYIPGE